MPYWIFRLYWEDNLCLGILSLATNLTEMNRSGTSNKTKDVLGPHIPKVEKYVIFDFEKSLSLRIS